MTKKNFIEELRRALCGLSEDEIQHSLDYYEEIINDRIESGMSEEEALKAIGTPEDIAREILLEMPLPKIIKTKYKQKRSWQAWEIILLILGSPIWLSLAIALLSIAFAAYAVIWSVVIALWATGVSLAAVSVFCTVKFALTLVSAAPFALLHLGTGFVCAGTAILLYFVCIKLTVLLVKASVALLRKLKSKIVERGILKQNKKAEVKDENSN